MIIFTAVIGMATFIENDFGASATQKVVFKTWWFELTLVLFSLSILANISRFRYDLYFVFLRTRKKIANVVPLITKNEVALLSPSGNSTIYA